jgi:hypothetical protein
MFARFNVTAARRAFARLKLGDTSLIELQKENFEMEIIDTGAGPYVIYNRDNEHIEFDKPLMGPGPWHFGCCDENGNSMLYRWGYETREQALNVMETHVWALINDCGWPQNRSLASRKPKAFVQRPNQASPSVLK